MDDTIAKEIVTPLHNKLMRIKLKYEWLAAVENRRLYLASVILIWIYIWIFYLHVYWTLTGKDRFKEGKYEL